MRLSQIWKYPVKSMLGGQVERAELGAGGVVGDRMWAVWDGERDSIASARRVAALSPLRAAYSDDGVTIELPDGTTVSSSDPDVDARLTEAIGHPSTLCAKPDASDTDHWRQGKSAGGDVMTEMRTIFGRLDDEPLPDFGVFPTEMFTYEYPPGNYFDCYPLMIMTTSALRSMRAALPDAAVDERRFRPSFVVDTGEAEGHPEFGWAGQRLRVGGCELQIGAACPRCVTVTRAFAPDLPADRSVLRHIVRDLDQNVGVYATVVRGGTIAVGDSVELL